MCCRSGLRVQARSALSSRADQAAHVRQPEHPGLDGPAGGWPAGPTALGPGGLAAADDAAVPAQDRVWGDQQPQPPAPRFGYHGEQGREQCPVPVRRRGCRRGRTASWWRRSRIAAVFPASSRRDSRSHEVIRVIRRKTNRRHMTGDHHGRTATRATLVTATEDILGTHKVGAFRGCHGLPARDGLGVHQPQPLHAARRSLREPVVVRHVARWLRDEEASASGTSGSGGSLTELP
jgi:hypothetical protein